MLKGGGKLDKTVRFNVNISNVEKINPLFSKCKINVLYHGINRNNSHLSKEVVNNNLYSIYNIPIVGEYLKEKDNFGGHGGKLEITDNDIKYVQTTIPYGTIPESAKVDWENITEKDGSVNEYLVIDGAYLWTGRYEELNNLLERKFNQSMEIEIQQGNFAVVDGQETFKIDEFIFSALCILGVDKDGISPEDHVEPAFESASIVTYSLDKDEFKKQFNQMVAELKFSLSNNNEGGNQVEDVKTNSTEEVIEEAVEENFESTEVVETETVEEVEESVETEETVEEETTETEEVVETDYQAKYEELKSDYEKLENDFTSYKEGKELEFTKLAKEKEELANFKSTKLEEERKLAENDLFERFSNELNEVEIKEMKESASKFTIQELEEKLFTLVGKKKAKFSVSKKQEDVKIGLEKYSVDKESTPYGELFDKFNK